MKTLNILYLFLFYAIFNIWEANYAYAQFFSGPVSAATGGAGRAGLEPAESSYLNPAAIAAASKNYLNFFYADQNFSSQNTYNQSGVIIVDAGVESFSPGAVSISLKDTYVNGQEIREKNYEVSFGKAWSKVLAFGVSFRRHEQTENSEDYADHNISWGAMYSPWIDFGLAVGMYNTIVGGEGRTPRQVYVGTHYYWRPYMRLLLDYVSDWVPENEQNKGKTMLGVEIPIGDQLAFRFGQQWNDIEDRNFYTLGLGWKGPRLGFNYVYQNNPNNGAETLHSLDFKLFF